MPSISSSKKDSPIETLQNRELLAQFLKKEIQDHEQTKEKLSILAQFPEENPTPILRVTPQGQILYANPAAIPLLTAWDCHESSFLPPLWLETLQTCLEESECQYLEVQAGQRLYSFLISPFGNTQTLYLNGQDITERKKYEDQLLLLASVFEHSGEGIIIANHKMIVQRVNPGYEEITGYLEEEVTGKPPRLFEMGKKDTPLVLELRQSLSQEGAWQGEVWIQRKNGEAFPIRLSIRAIRNSKDVITHYIGSFHDITEIKRTEFKMEYQAYHDALTGLPNRLLFNDRLEKSLQSAQRHQQKLAVLFLDLDNFKDVNDSLGHQVGDLLLKSVSQKLLQCCREEDTVARLGGDEFVIILNKVQDHRDPIKVANRILQSLSQKIRLENHEIYAGVSIGISLFPEDGSDVDTLMRSADAAMYNAKKQGKNNYSLFTQAMGTKALKRLAMEYALHQALEKNEFTLHYQPKIETQTGKIVGTEALLRWNHSEKGLIPPADFIPLAEDTGLIIPIGQWVLRTACEQTKAWLDAGYSNLPVAVNLSAVQFQSENLLQSIQNILQETGLPAHYLNLEITENTVMANVKDSSQVLAKLSEMGVTISLDDFGTGYSSLSYLKKFSIDTLKIDRSFLEDLPDNAEDVAIAKAILSMAGSLKIRVVAEGVEREEQMQFMTDNHCDEVQGFLFSKPLPAEDFISWVQAREG
ncbi:MAG: diguanylate cyclase [SAR324 cluster bacterium]|uniref:Diguanylate cyclase n=1 Tax=SAR324 cluster bacterium TaxID=2024889 RepID=A0A2A4SMI0_9DELT|nr:MAG: diguanylate cyclase [SAR324 cluster bacterium]